MYEHSFELRARLVASIAILCVTASACAQNPSATAPQDATPAQAQANPAKSENDAMLARAGNLYYSTTKFGLGGFTCAIHPDWYTLFVSARKGETVRADDPRIVLLKTVRLTLHAQMKGGSTLDWEPAPDPNNTLDPDSVTLLKDMHAATDQTLQGFLQFWTPFADGSAVPENSEGLDITKTGNGYRLHAVTSDTEVTEEMDSQLTLTRFNVVMKQATVDFAPTYGPTSQGLLVNGFLAHILAAGEPAEKTQEMHVGIEYEVVDGFQIPSRLNMEVIGSGTFNFSFDDCTVSRQAN